MSEGLAGAPNDIVVVVTTLNVKISPPPNEFGEVQPVVDVETLDSAGSSLKFSDWPDFMRQVLEHVGTREQALWCIVAHKVIPIDNDDTLTDEEKLTKAKVALRNLQNMKLTYNFVKPEILIEELTPEELSALGLPQVSTTDGDGG